MPGVVRGPRPIPPFWVTYSVPSAAIAAPLGPPLVVANGSTSPAGVHRDTTPPVISVNSNVPSTHTGPSGNDNPLAMISPSTPRHQPAVVRRSRG